MQSLFRPTSERKNPSLQMHSNVPFCSLHFELVGQFRRSLHSLISSLQSAPVHPVLQKQVPFTLLQYSVCCLLHGQLLEQLLPHESPVQSTIIQFASSLLINKHSVKLLWSWWAKYYTKQNHLKNVNMLGFFLSSIHNLEFSH